MTRDRTLLDYTVVPGYAAPSHDTLLSIHASNRRAKEAVAVEEVAFRGWRSLGGDIHASVAGAAWAVRRDPNSQGEVVAYPHETPAVVHPGETIAFRFDGVRAQGPGRSAGVTVCERSVAADGAPRTRTSDLFIDVWDDGPAVTRFTADPVVAKPLQEVALTWSTSAGDWTLSDDESVLSTRPAHTVIVRPAATTTYTLAQADAQGRQAQLTVSVPAPTIVTFKGDRSDVDKGSHVLFHWETRHAGSGTFDGARLRPDEVVRGQRSISPMASGSHTLWISSAADPPPAPAAGVSEAPGERTASQTFPVLVHEPVLKKFTVEPRYVRAGQMVTVEWEVEHASGVLIVPPLLGTQGPAGSGQIPAITPLIVLIALPTGVQLAAIQIQVTWG